jgi:3-isopropylmalate dehydrogenase
MTKKYKIATYPGDGVGPEIIGEGVKVLKAAIECVSGLDMEFQIFQGGEKYAMDHGKDVEEGGLDAMKTADAIYFGAIGHPGAPPFAGKTLIALPRWYMDEYINLRPVKIYPGVRSIVRKLERRMKPTRLDVIGGDLTPDDVDFHIIRENSEGLYSQIEGYWKGKELWIDKGEIKAVFPIEGKRPRVRKKKVTLDGGATATMTALSVDSDFQDLAFTMRIITRRASERACKYAFELAKREGRKRVACIDKSNVMQYSCGLFRKVYDEVAAGYPGIERDYNYIDAATQWILRDPGWYDVVVTPNEFGDILSDMCSVLAGGLGMMPGANIGDTSGMFEPIAGSAPKYAGMKVVNPIGTILAGKLMLEWLGGTLRTPNDKRGGDEKCLQAAKLVDRGVAEVLREGKIRTYDLGGSSKNDEVGDAIAKKIRELAKGG